MATDNLDSADLKAVGAIREMVLDEIFEIDVIPLPFSQSVGSRPVDNSYAEFMLESLQAINTDNAAIDGESSASEDDTAPGGPRVGNQCQIPWKTIRVSDRSRNSNTVGYSDTYARQLLQRGREARRDLEAISLLNQASVADNGSTTPGRLGGFPSWMTTNTSRGATGADGGFAAGVVAAATPGEARAISETLVRQIAGDVWKQGGNPTRLMSVPDVCAQLSQYMFTASARIATLQKEASGSGAATAIGSVNVFLTDFGVSLEFVPNRLQQVYDSGDGAPVPVADVFIYDPEMVAHGWLQPWMVKPNARNGLADSATLSADVTLLVLNEAAHGVIADIDPALAAVA